TYAYNSGNQRTAVTNTAGNYVTFGYDPGSQLKTALGFESNGIVRLQEQLGYAYDTANNIKYRTNNALIQTFTVNNLNQLWTNTRSGTLTVGGTTVSAATNVTVADNGNSAVAAFRYTNDNTFARAGVTLLDGTN